VQRSTDLFREIYGAVVEVCGIENVDVGVIGPDPADATTEKSNPQ